MPPLTAGASPAAMDSPASSSSPSSSSSALSAAGLPKVYRRRKKPPSAATGEIAATELPLPDSPEYESREVSEEERACVECSTSSTPLWRRGPAGPKSLCNACGLRYKKRNRTCSKSSQSLNNNTVMEKVERHAKDVFLLQRKVAGREEAEAARLLMALSSDISYFDFLPWHPSKKVVACKQNRMPASMANFANM